MRLQSARLLQHSTSIEGDATYPTLPWSFFSLNKERGQISALAVIATQGLTTARSEAWPQATRNCQAQFETNQTRVDAHLACSPPRACRGRP